MQAGWARFFHFLLMCAVVPTLTAPAAESDGFGGLPLGRYTCIDDAESEVGAGFAILHKRVGPNIMTYAARAPYPQSDPRWSIDQGANNPTNKFEPFTIELIKTRERHNLCPFIRELNATNHLFYGLLSTICDAPYEAQISFYHQNVAYWGYSTSMLLGDDPSDYLVMSTAGYIFSHSLGNSGSYTKSGTCSLN